jgi:hypothetical protein
MKDIDRYGFTTCYTCGQRFHWKQLQAGHMVAGRTNAILFSDLTKPQCLQCNFFRGGEQGKFTLKMIDEVGRERVEQEYTLKQQTKKFSAEELQEKINFYKQKVKEYENDPELVRRSPRAGHN